MLHGACHHRNRGVSRLDTVRTRVFSVCGRCGEPPLLRVSPKIFLRLRRGPIFLRLAGAAERADFSEIAGLSPLS